MNLDFLNQYLSQAYAIETDKGCMRYICEGRSKADFEAVVADGAKNGAIPMQKRGVGENLFATLRFPDGDAVVSYFNYNHTLCIVTDTMEGRVAPPLEAAACEKLTVPKLGFLDLHSPEASKEGNGLGMVYTLSDGSFIIYDGGYYDDADGLLEYLDEHNVRDEKPRIAAWVLTHSHGDHYFAMKRVAAKYADRVTVENFVVSVRNKVYEYEQYEPYLNELFATEALPKFEGAKLVKPHTGQMLCYRDACIEILSTQEEILPSHFRWLNETSIISRIFLGGQSVFMPADAELGVDVMIPTIYGDALKSDFLQQTHHGFSGGSYTMYDLVRPKVAFWTCQPEKFEKYCHPHYNNGYNYYLKNMVKANYHYGNGNVTFELPYDI
ncbi:MAG: MBL fold metallo-hydrolase [Clostridia bacterium]|nr:MBL fold metallo-hydrolase [Clostridia bacterium]